jgi:hypothetical protein
MMNRYLSGQMFIKKTLIYMLDASTWILALYFRYCCSLVCITLQAGGPSGTHTGQNSSGFRPSLLSYCSSQIHSRCCHVLALCSSSLSRLFGTWYITAPVHAWTIRYPCHNFERFVSLSRLVSTVQCSHWSVSCYVATLIWMAHGDHSSLRNRAEIWEWQSTSIDKRQHTQPGLREILTGSMCFQSG